MQWIEPSDIDRLLVLAPHPDDESLSSAGLIQRAVGIGATVRVVYATRGENNPWPQRALSRRWKIGPAEKRAWGERRTEEAFAALTELGLSKKNAVFMDYEDQRLTELLLSEAEFVSRLEDAIRTFRPTILVAPSRLDLHPDHNALAMALEFALDNCRPPGLLLLRYIIHNRKPRTPDQVFGVQLSARERLAKRRAILAHKSQMILSKRRFMRYTKGNEIFFQDSETSHPESFEFFAKSSRHLQIGYSSLTNATLSILVIPGHTLQIKFRPFRSPVAIQCGTPACAVVMVKSQNRIEFMLPDNFSMSGVWSKVTKPWHFLDWSGWQYRPLEPQSMPMLIPRRICAVIPCYNVSQLCAPIVRAAARYADSVIAVDDGSTDGTRQVLDAIVADCRNVEILTHPENQGKGAALLTGMRHALAHASFDVLVTLDGDAQHRAEDIPRMVDVLHSNAADLVIGQREAFEAMPLRSRLGNEITAKLFRWIYPEAPKDTQCGFRVFSHEFSSRIVNVIKGERYETELNILLYALECGHPVSVAPIPTVYLNGNRSSHFKPVLDSLRILRALFRWWWGRLWREGAQKLEET